MHSKTDFTHENCSCLTATSAAAEHTKIMHTVVLSEKKEINNRNCLSECMTAC